MPRPTSVTVICWIYIVLSVLGVIPILLLSVMPLDANTQNLIAQNPLPLNAQIALGVFSMLVNLLCSIMMLKGKSWARTLFVAWALVGFGISFATSPVKLMLFPSLIVWAIVVFFLFRPNANAYFAVGKAK